jgi:hypothetical protein
VLRACRAVALAATCDEADDEGIAFAADGSLVVTSEGGRKKSPATFARLACTLE